MKCALVATAKDEGPFLLEWVAYHRMIGFDPLILFQNDSTDHTVDILTELDRIGAVQYFDNPARQGRHQVRAYRRATELPRYLASDWAMAIDLDEFLYVKCGTGRVQDLIAAVPDCERILVNWRLFGASGQSSLSDELVTARFVKCEAADEMATTLKAYKTLFQTARVGRPGVHQVYPKDSDPRPLRTVNGSGLTEDAFQIKNFRATDPGLLRLAQVNHYVLRDASSFLIKSDRGSAHQSHRELREAFWDRRNRRSNRDMDLGLQARAPEIRAAMAALDVESGGRLMRLRRRALARYRERLTALLDEPDYRALFVHCAANA